MRSLKLLSLVLAGLLIFTGCDSNDANDEPEETRNLVEVAVDAGFSTLATAVTAADLIETLSDDGPFTVFAPTDAAFGDVAPATLESLLQPENKATLQAVLTYHVVPGRLTAEDVTSRSTWETVQGELITISVVDGQAKVNNANIQTVDVPASNGIIHIIDAVILPPSQQ